MSENQQNNSGQIAGAITFPNRSVDNVQPVAEQPRQPRNLQGLLRFAMEADTSEGAASNSNFSPMDDERRKFLEEALSSLTVDISVVIRGSIKILSDAEKIRSIQLGDTLPDDVQRAFDNLLELVDDIDVANDFYKLGGFTIFPVCFSSENETVRALANKVLGDACQNNPFCQEKVLEEGLMSAVLTLVQSETGDALAKAIYALSCACRECPAARGALVAAGGGAALAARLAAGGAAGTKAAFLVRYLCHNCPDAKENFIELNIVRTIATQIKNGRTSTTEHLLSILLALLENRPYAVVRQCTDPELGLQKILERHQSHPDLLEDSFLEEKEYTAQLLTILKSCPQVDSDEEVDR